MTITLNAANPKSESIKFRGNAAIKISPTNFQCFVTMKFMDSTGTPYKGHSLKEDTVNTRTWIVEKQTFDVVFFELSEPSKCINDIVFDIELIPSKSQHIPFDYFI